VKHYLGRIVTIDKYVKSIDNLELLQEEGVMPVAKGMHASVGEEYVEFTSECKLIGKVECYL
jgi:hypothetical protein